MPIVLTNRRDVSELVPSRNEVALVKGFEGLSLKAYPDPASPRAKEMAKPLAKRVPGWEKLSGEPWTIGWGRAYGVKEGDTCTLAQAEAWLVEDLAISAQKVRNVVTVPLTQGEFDCLVDMAFNLKSWPPKSLMACINGGVTDAGKVMEPGSYGSAKLQIPRYCRAGGKPMKGLYRRCLARACAFDGVPWENACSDGVIRFALDARGEIDPEETTSLADTLERATRDLRIDAGPPPDFSKPWPLPQTTVADDTLPPAEPVHIPHPDPEIFEEAPEPEAKPTIASPVVVAEEAPAVVSGSQSQPLPAPTPPLKPAAPAPNDPANQETKDMVLSKRFWGMLITAMGSLNFLPRAVSDFFKSPDNRELIAWMAVIIVGSSLYYYGKHKAKHLLK